MAALPLFVTNAERELLGRAADDVRALIAAADDYLGRCLKAPTTGSTVAACAGSYLDGQWVHFAAQSIHMANDHLRTLLRSWAPPDPISDSAGFTVVRGAAEASARACWLTDTTLSDRERTARGILEARYSWDNVARVLIDPTPALAERDRLTEAAAAVGFRLAGGSREGTCNGERRPGSTWLLASLLPAPVPSEAGTQGQLAYAWLSGHAHAEPWVFLLDMMRAGAGQVAAPLNVERLVSLLRVGALRLYNLAMLQMVELAGHDDAAWRRVAARRVTGM
jgi:hypothetical protein